MSLDGRIYSLGANANLLQSLLKQGELIHHSCLAGGCRSCALYLPNGDELLACQHQVSCDLQLHRLSSKNYDVPVDVQDIRVVGNGLSVVVCHANMALLPGDRVDWLVSKHSGRTISLDRSDRSLTIALPTSLANELPDSGIRFAKQQQRNHTDPSLKAVVFCDHKVLPIAQKLLDAFKGENYQVHAKPIVTDFSSPLVGYQFQRFDLAYVVTFGRYPMMELERLLHISKVRVDQYQYLPITN